MENIEVCSLQSSASVTACMTTKLNMCPQSECREAPARGWSRRPQRGWPASAPWHRPGCAAGWALLARAAAAAGPRPRAAGPQTAALASGRAAPAAGPLPRSPGRWAARGVLPHPATHTTIIVFIALCVGKTVSRQKHFCVVEF